MPVAMVSRLEEVGLIEVLPTGEVVESDTDVTVAEAAEGAAEAQEHHKLFERSRIEMMRGYAEVLDCRRRYLLNYFGEEYDAPCGYCDNCQAGITVAADVAHQPFPLNSRVTHTQWGDGSVQRYEGEKMVVLFDAIGYKTLDVALVTANNLLTPAGDAGV